MNNNIALRQAYGEALLKLGEERNDFLVFDADLSGGTMTDIFASKFPERFFDFGIAEQNMVSAAAGLSTTGLIPIVNTYAVFVLRAVEQIRNSIALPRFNVKIVASHAGLDLGQDGASHQAVEDLAVMRSIPNMVVMVPADGIEIREMLKTALDYEGPVYIRGARSPIPKIHNRGYHYQIGKANLLQDGCDVTIIAIGVMVYRALEAYRKLKQEGISSRIVNCSTLKPIDKEILIESASQTGAIVTVEDHNVIGGLGGAVAEVLVKKKPVPLEMVGIKDTFGESGLAEELFEKYGLTIDNIVKAAKKAIKRKREFK